MRILFVVPYLPSLIRVRPYNLVRALAQRDHRITLLALHPSGDDAGGLASLRGWCQSVRVVQLPRWRPLWNGLRALPTSIPFQAAHSRSPQMTQLIRRTLMEDRYDVVHLEHLRGSELSRAFGPGHPPIVFDAVDSISLLFERAMQNAARWQSRLMARIDLSRTRGYEGRFTQRFSRVLVTSPEDCSALAALAHSTDRTQEKETHRPIVLPNGVDLAYFKPLQEPHRSDAIIFSGKMSYHANTAAALDLIQLVMPIVWAEYPQTKVWLVGKDPPANLRELSSDPRVRVTGTVPDIRPYLGRAAVAVSPLRYGVGIQNKVLEAMAMGTPVVTTTGACRALVAELNTDLLVGDSPPESAQAILALLADEKKRHRLGAAGRLYVEKHHDWDRIAAQLELVYQEAITTSISERAS